MEQVSRYFKIGIHASQVLSLTIVLNGCTSEINNSNALNANLQPPYSTPAPSPTPSPGDANPPTISLVAPVAGTVSGLVTVSANAFDNVGVVGVQFRLNGANLGSEDTSAPYQVNWNTSALTPGATYILSATARDAAGLTTTSADVSVMVQAPPPVPRGLIFFDNFEYEVGRDALDAADRFMQLGRWDWVKTEQSNEPGANGNLYTVSAIPGYTGSFPGLVSQRVLAMEARPDLGNGQTDFYLQFGSGTRPIGHIPPNHWYQFWLYSPDVPGVDGQSSLYTNAKFIYPNRAEYYPATLNNGGFIYILGLNKRSKAPRSIAPCGFDRDVGCTSAFLNAGWNRSQGLTNRIPYEEEDFGANLADDLHVLPNRWTLVKIHIDISGTDSRAASGQAVFEMWIRRYGSSTWTKTTEYIGGVTDVGGGAIDFTPAYTDGFRMLRIPTTFGSASPSPANWLASWTYLDDFAIASTEAALPQYP